MTPFDLGWAVGIFEGEGTLGVTKHGRPFVAVYSNDREVLERFERIVAAGTIRPMRPGQWAWKLDRIEEAQRVVALLLPHLSERRRRQAAAVMAVRRVTGAGRTRCSRGHELADAGTLHDGRCAACHRAAMDRRNGVRRAQRAARRSGS